MVRALPLFLAAALGAAVAAPVCTVATPACMEKIPLGGEGRYSLVYRSFALTEKNAKIEQAIIVVHGAGRNADSYFLSGVAGALISNTMERTLVVAPRIASASGGSCVDELEKGEISWTCSGLQDWRGGGAAHQLPNITTFDFVDEIVKRLANRDVFPNLKLIVVTGHSAGGQFTNRYAAANKVDGVVKTAIKYVVSNPSTYLYLDTLRPPSDGVCSVKDGCTKPFTAYAEGANCTTFNNWRNGLERKAGYAAKIDDETLRKNLAKRDVDYLLGELDTLPLFGFDGSCPAMAQGGNRLVRGVNYWNYMKANYNARHELVLVPACGHNGRCIYTSDEARPLLFPR